MDLNKPWQEYTFVAFDTETSGAYPLGAEIVEFGMVKWKAGKEVDSYQTLLKPSFPMSDFIIGIHGISNEMVQEAPLMGEKIQEIRNFFKDCVLMAHHAPFDMGFLTVDLEKNKMPLPSEPVLCTSLLARKLIPESPNHKLQTLIKVLKLDGGTAHRAHDDARACLNVGLECLRRIGETSTLKHAIKAMGKDLEWQRYSLMVGQNELYQKVVEATVQHKDMDIVYEGGSLRGQTRRISPIGIVRNPDGDYVMAVCHLDRAQKRFYLGKISDASVVF
jgi:DNA polymerase-3 subunit epsilon